MRITSYFSILNETQILTERNQFLQICIRNLVHDLQIESTTKSQSSNQLDNDSVLKLLFESARKNSTRDKGGYRHSEAIKKFAAYIRLLGGNQFYEMLHANLSLSIPSPSTIHSYISCKGPQITEGKPRIDELLLFLQKWNVPLAKTLLEWPERLVTIHLPTNYSDFLFLWHGFIQFLLISLFVSKYINIWPGGLWFVYCGTEDKKTSCAHRHITA